MNPIVFPSMMQSFLKSLKKHEKYVYEIIENAVCEGVRFVKSKYGNRHEACFSNNMKVKVPEAYFKFCPNKLPQANLNY